MIIVERQEKNQKQKKKLTISTSWDEVMYSTFIQVMKDGILENENDYERTVKLISALSDNPKEAERWIMEMSLEDFANICKEFDLPDYKDLPAPADNKKKFTIDGKKYKIRDQDDIVFNEWLAQTTFERLKQEYKGTEDWHLALGMILREVDSKGNFKPFTVKSFEYIVNNLADKVKTIDVYKSVNFFLSGVKQRYLDNLPRYTIKRVKSTPKA